ncbi:ABC transporter substrate-binding protein [Antrihabitans sp. YC2-6]|uniref:ABC transporter substrate-binding protein n=1 Tax=Antrihabitans sp. YC2-6 TaxID=2799498 RepID=UPI0018F54797|nr:ABC transporter substrate-binding protein [Antrihabitans sp. YC2-6]MBJ8348083.1 ABC transporter substrate-binding protein [Antrihabitans sp. YC2-6]
MKSKYFRRLAGSVVATVAVFSSATGCSSTDDATSNCTVAADAPTVRFALDWTPNTNHTGLFVAQQKCFFADAGLNVEILPYNDTSPDTLIDSGNAEFGISFQSSATFAKASGADTVSVLAPLQHWATAIGVKADRTDLTSPKSLDGLTYAGFGDAGEVQTLQQVIRNDGGTGDFKDVTLVTAAYEAVYAGQADFTVPYIEWEGIEAEERGTPFRYFHYTDYGFPDAYAIIVNGSQSWLSSHPDEARKFVGALQKGYQLSADDPAQAAQLFLDANPDMKDDSERITLSQRNLAEKYMLDSSGQVGTQTLEQWTGFSRFLFQNGVLVDEAGNTLTSEPDWSTYFTNEYLGTA